MSRSSVVLSVFASIAVACSTSPDPDSPSDAGADGAITKDASIDASADALLPGDASDAGLCCPRDPTLSGCMSLGGSAAADGGCPPKACDFFCSTNWRVESDPRGCPFWRWDRRDPLPDENASCFKRLDAGTD